MAENKIPQNSSAKQTIVDVGDGRVLQEMAGRVVKLRSRDEKIADQIVRYIEKIIKPSEQLKLAENAIKSELTAEDYSFPELKKAAKAIWDLKAPDQRRQAELFAEYTSSAVYELVLERIGKIVEPPDDGRDSNTQDWVSDHEA